MTKITELVEQVKEVSPLSSFKSGILEFFEQHGDEVYRKRDVVKHFQGQINSNTVRVHIHNLWKAGLIGRHKVGGTGYYGSVKAIQKLKQALET